MALAMGVSCKSPLPRARNGSRAALPPSPHRGPARRPKGSSSGRPLETSHLPHVQAFLCDSSARGWIRHPHRSGTARAPQRQDHHDLHPRSQPRRTQCAQPGGFRARKPSCRLGQIGSGTRFISADRRGRPIHAKSRFQKRFTCVLSRTRLLLCSASCCLSCRGTAAYKLVRRRHWTDTSHRREPWPTTRRPRRRR